jgi:DNA polymerase-3 subunit alpha (Gram-positive type)
MNAMKDGDIFSLEDLRGRAKISKSVVEILEKNGALKGMSKTNQLSLFG